MMDMLHGRGMPPRIALGLVAAGIAAAASVGCSPVPPDLDSATGRALQSRVLAVTSAAANGDPAAGLRSLDELVDHVTRAAADGEMSFKRHQSIIEAVETVRADLRAAKAAAEKAASAEAAAEKTAAAKAAAEKAAAAKATADAAAQAAGTGGAATQNIPAPPVPVTSATAPPPSRTAPATENAAEENRAKGADKGKGRKEG